MSEEWDFNRANFNRADYDHGRPRFGMAYFAEALAPV